MELAMGTMGSLLPKLGVLLDEEYKLQESVKRDFQYLQRELQSMHAALSEVAEVQRDQLQQQDRLWASDVRELSQDIEDVVDSFLVRIEGPAGSEPAAQPTGCFKGLIVKMKKCKARHQIATAIKDIKNQVHEVANRDGRYRGPHGVVAHVTAATRVTSATVDPLLVALYGAKRNIVGIDDAKDEIITKLCEGDDVSKQQLRILSIVGFGGLGKTTLAKAVYDELRAQFNRWAFVTVSQNPDVRKVLRDLLYELDNQKHKKLSGAILLNEKQLIDELRKSLETKRYFIVIDDLWGVEAWEIIRYALLDSNRGSRIITTTRNLDVSKACCSSNNDIIYKMRPLSDKDSQILFYKRIFPSGTGCPDELEQVSREILKKCGGVPLAIITIASHLAGDQQIKPKDQWDALLNSIGRGLTRGGGVEEMRRILSLSYYDLHYRLKACLLYLSIFPEDSEISKYRLIRRWIAEGFFQGENYETNLFDLGESYFNTLINRSMIQPVDINAEGRAEACRVHDVMLDFICDLSSEENFVTVLDFIKEGTPFKRKIRRMSLQKSTAQLTSTRLDRTSMLQVRSFTVFSPAASQMLPLSRFQVLRVLDLEGCCLGESHHLDLRNIGNLLHLRYLGLRGIELPIGLRNLTSLEELTGVGCYCAELVKELGHLTNLRALDISWGGSERKKEEQALVESLCNLHKLQSLEIRGTGELVYLGRYWVPPPHLRRLVLRVWLQTLPTWFGSSSSLPLLSYLHMNVREVWLEDIQTLGLLPSLRFVSLRAGVDLATEQCDVERFSLSADAFPCARQCVFLNVTMVPCNFPRGAMPMVQSLRFDLRVLDILSGDFDLSMSSLPSLEDLYIDYDMKKARR
ncbi:Disease resistance protein RPP13, partial [Dichanthelium oligosanthes]